VLDGGKIVMNVAQDGGNGGLGDIQSTAVSPRTDASCASNSLCATLRYFPGRQVTLQLLFSTFYTFVLWKKSCFADGPLVKRPGPLR